MIKKLDNWQNHVLKNSTLWSFEFWSRLRVCANLATTAKGFGITPLGVVLIVLMECKIWFQTRRRWKREPYSMMNKDVNTVTGASTCSNIHRFPNNGNHTNMRMDNVISQIQIYLCLNRPFTLIKLRKSDKVLHQMQAITRSLQFQEACTSMNYSRLCCRLRYENKEMITILPPIPLLWRVRNELQIYKGHNDLYTSVEEAKYVMWFRSSNHRMSNRKYSRCIIDVEEKSTM